MVHQWGFFGSISSIRKIWSLTANSRSLQAAALKRLTKKDVEKYFKRCEASLSSKTCDAIVDTFIQLSCRGLAYFLPLDQEKLLNNLKKDFMVKRELYTIAGGLYLRYGSYMAAASAALLTLNNLKLEDEDLEKNLDENLEKIEKELGKD